MLKTIGITVLIVAICIALLCVRMLFRKNGKFVQTHIGGNEALRKKGVGCIQTQDFEARRTNRHAIAERMPRQQGER